MATQKFRNASVYIENKKAGNAAKATLDMVSGSEDYVGDGQYLGTSDGVITSKLDLDQYVPIGSKPEIDKLLQKFLNKEYINIAIGVVGNKIFKWNDMKVVSVKVDTDMAKGTLMLSASLQGGTPEVAG